MTVEESMEVAGNILVSVRIRPLNEKEAARNEDIDWECSNDKSIMYKNNAFSSDRSMYPSSYSFDKVFGPNCSTRQVYQEGAKAIALSVVAGVNSSVFAYGQTSSGKTYTMTGITEYAMADIFDHIHKHTEREFVMRFSAMEIYNESVRDLLSVDATPLRLLVDPERGTVVDKLTEEVVRDWNHLAKLLSVCRAQRQIVETLLNESSSRSHQIIKLTVESHAREVAGKDGLNALFATVNFIDLGGSESASQGSSLKEALYINHSLITLEAVICKLSMGRNELIPYRESKLTRILQPFLGSNNRTAIICTIIPARSYTEQSRKTLLFATSAKQVRSSAVINLQLSDKASAKHAQTKLSRHENELDSIILEKEKELLIHKLERQVMELTLQRDLALSRIKDVQIEEPGNPPYPKLLVRRQSWASQTSQGSPAAKLHSFSSDPAPLRASQCYCRCCAEHSTSSHFDDNTRPRSHAEPDPFEFSYDESPRLFIRSLVDQEDEENRPLEPADEEARMQDPGLSSSCDQNENSGSLPSLQLGVQKVGDQVDQNKCSHEMLSGKSMAKKATEVPSTNAVVLYKNASMKKMKHFGVQYDLISQEWVSDFERLRREVINLWDACNVSLVYRTSFFLLFAGEAEDAIYMEVERRRLSFVKDAFAWGKETVLDGQIISPSLSNKHMQQERQMLSKMMKSRISKDEREILYIKWRIHLDTKKRRSQLIGHLWTKPRDMDHVQESAAVVSMLIRFDKSRVRKEMFGINLMPALKGLASHTWLHTASVRVSP